MTDVYKQYLCACLRANADSAQVLTQTLGWEWERLLQKATEEVILPSLADIVRNGFDIGAPAEITDFLDEVLTLNRERNAHIWNELKAAVRLLNEIGIEPVLLKGAAYLASGTYGDAATRYLLDLDVLLPQTQLQKAVDRLVANGYSVDATDAFGKYRHHHPQVSRGSVAIELHHKLGFGSCERVLPAQEVIDSAAPLDLEGVRVRVPSPTHLAMHLVLHSQVQHPYNERIWPPLRAMYDLVQLEQRFGGAIDWKEIADRFTSAGHYGLMVLHLIDVHEALGFKLPFASHLTPTTRLRLLRRRALRRLPVLRYVDPIYMPSVLLKRRLRVLRSALVTPGGVRHLATHLFAPSVFERLLLDVREGRGH